MPAVAVHRRSRTHADLPSRRGGQGDGERRRRRRPRAAELDRGQIVHLVLVDGAPVVGQNPPGVTGVRVPRPVRPTHVLGPGRDVDGAVVVQIAGDVGVIASNHTVSLGSCSLVPNSPM